MFMIRYSPDLEDLGLFVELAAENLGLSHSLSLLKNFCPCVLCAGSIPGVNSDQMKLVIKLGVPRSTQHLLDIEMVKSVFP